MTVTIGRRELLAALGGAAAWPLVARACSFLAPTQGGGQRALLKPLQETTELQVEIHAQLPLHGVDPLISGDPPPPCRSERLVALPSTRQCAE
jgi:hypothetical protein